MRALSGDDCRFIAANMRQIDRDEVRAMSGRPDADRASIMIDLMTNSRGLARCALLDGVPVAAWGVVTRTAISSTGNPWMLATDGVRDRHFSRQFIARSRSEFEKTIPSHVSFLWNMVASDNDASIRWLKWLNFSFRDEVVSFGGIDWRIFEMSGE